MRSPPLPKPHQITFTAFSNTVVADFAKLAFDTFVRGTSIPWGNKFLPNNIFLQLDTKNFCFFTYRILNRIEMYLPNTPSSFRAVPLGKVSRKNVAVLLDFFQMREWGRALTKLFVTFSWVHFWSIKGVYLLQNANKLNFKLFLGCIHDPQSKYSAFFKKNFG